MPGEVPKIAVEGELGASIVAAAPLTCVHVPIPTDGVFPVNCTVPVQAVNWVVPATDVVGTADIVILTIS